MRDALVSGGASRSTVEPRSPLLAGLNNRALAGLVGGDADEHAERARLGARSAASVLSTVGRLAGNRVASELVSADRRLSAGRQLERLLHRAATDPPGPAFGVAQRKFEWTKSRAEEEGGPAGRSSNRYKLILELLDKHDQSQAPAHLQAIVHACQDFLDAKPADDNRTKTVKAVMAAAQSEIGGPGEDMAADSLAEARRYVTSLGALSGGPSIRRAEALILREFGLTIKDFNGVELAHIWRCLELVPKSQVTRATNERLHGLVREGGFGGSYGENKGKIGWGLGRGPNPKSVGGGTQVGTVKWIFLGGAAGRGRSRVREAVTFDHTVLHEIGHSVEAKLNVMNRFGGDTERGGWVEYNKPETFAADIVAATGGSTPDALVGTDDLAPAVICVLAKKSLATVFNAANKAQEARIAKATEEDTFLKTSDEQHAKKSESTAPFREKLETRQAYNERHAQENAAGLAAAQEKRAKLMAGKDQRDAAIASGRARLERGRRAFTQALEASAAVILARRVMKAGEYAWLKNLSDQRAYGLEANGRIFTKSYPEKYASYAVAGRVDEVSKYQWRAPGEWFAEMYAAYFGGYLAKNHPQRAWLKGIVDQPIAAPAEETPAPPEPQITEPVEAPNPVQEPPSSEPVSSGQKELPDPSVTAQALISEPPSEAPSLPTPQSSPEMPPTTSTAPTPEASDEPASMAAGPTPSEQSSVASVERDAPK